MHVREKARTRCNRPIHGNLDQSLIQEFPSPNVQVNEKLKLALMDSHADFPERNRRNGQLAATQPAFNSASGFRPQPPIALLMPKQGMSIEEYQNNSSSDWPASSNHSAGIGSTVSPSARMLPRLRPKASSGLPR